MDARAVAFGGLMVISAVQLLPGNVLVPASALLWYAAELVDTRGRMPNAPLAEPFLGQ
jgi:hypothetical protein